MEDTFPPTNAATLQRQLQHQASQDHPHHRLTVVVKEDLMVVVNREAIRARDPTASLEVMVIEEEDTSRLTTEVVIVNKEATEVLPTEISTAVILRDLMTLRTLVEEEAVTERKAHQTLRTLVEDEAVMLLEEAMEEVEAVVITTNIVAEEAPTLTQDAMTMAEEGLWIVQVSHHTSSIHRFQNLRTRLATLVEEEVTQEAVATAAKVAIVRAVTVKVAIAAKAAIVVRAAIVAAIVVRVVIAAMLQEETLITSCLTSTQTVKVG